LLGERLLDGTPVEPQPASAGIDTLLLGCTHYPLIEAAIRAADRRSDRARRLGHGDRRRAGQDLLAINGLEAPGSSRGTAADPGAAGHDRPLPAGGPATHRQLTTGSVESFHELAQRLFGDGFVDVEPIELGVPVG
jgi:hypothetical protein